MAKRKRKEYTPRCIKCSRVKIKGTWIKPVAISYVSTDQVSIVEMAFRTRLKEHILLEDGTYESAFLKEGYCEVCGEKEIKKIRRRIY